jgi:hypothetical protein
MAIAIKTQADFSAMIKAGTALPLGYSTVSDRLVTLYDYVAGGAPKNPIVLGCLTSFTDNSETITVGQDTCCEEDWIKKYKFEFEIACPTVELLSLWHRSDAVEYNPTTVASITTTLDVPSSILINAGRGRLGVLDQVDMVAPVVSLVAPATPATLVLGTDYRIVDGLIVLLPTTRVIAAAGLVNAITVVAPRTRQIEFKKNTLAIPSKVLIIEYTVGRGAAEYRDIFHNITLSSLPAGSSLLDEKALTAKFSFIANKDDQGRNITVQVS